MKTVDELPNDPLKLKQIIVSQLYSKIRSQEEQLNTYQSKSHQLKESNKQLEKENSHLHELVRLLKHRHFGKKSEVLSKEQLGLFNEAEEVQADAENQSKALSVEIKSHKRGKPKRKPLPDDLPREEVIIDLPEDQRVCGEGHVLKEIGEEVSEKLDVEPMKMKVIRMIRKKYACPCCVDIVKTAPLPPSAIPKSMASEGLLSFIATSKYEDGLPLYRLEQNIFKRVNVDLNRGTMAAWMIRIGEFIQPMINLMDEDLLSSCYLSCDETRVQVLKEKGKTAESRSYMWVRMRDGPKKIILYDYSPSRGGETARQLLEGFRGYLQVDGYEGYNGVCGAEGVIRVGCWAHARRKFFEAYQASKKGQGKAAEILILIKSLYKIEERIKDLSLEKRYRVRQSESKPILDKIRQWLDDHQTTVPPKSTIGQAINYASNEWTTLIRYIEDGKINIDNNHVENAIRPFVIGRKNWLFSDTVAGAESSARIYSLIETAKANGHIAYTYLRHVLKELPKAGNLSQVEALLPYHLNPKKNFPTD